MTKVVIVGGGVAGVTLVRSLSKHSSKFEVILVDSKECFVNKLSLTPSIGFRTNSLKANTIPYEHIISNTCVKFVRDGVQTVNLKEKHLVTTSGTSIDFDCVVICTGMSSMENQSSIAIDGLNSDNIEEVNGMIKTASLIRVVGGGPTGVEVATSLADHFNSKKIELVHSGKELLEEFPKVNQKLSTLLKQMPNLTIKLNHKWTPEKQDNEECVVINCSSFLPNSSMMLEHHHDLLSEDGFIKVDANCKIIGFESAFAVGDVSDLCKQDQKLVVSAIGQAKCVSAQIIERESGNEKPNSVHQPQNQWDTCIILGKQKFISILPILGISNLGALMERKKANAQDYRTLFEMW